jgi:acetyltransferase-like isoleucine patch superfamily enzyme
MRLSALKSVGNLEIINDGEFTTIGLISQKKPDMLSFLDDTEEPWDITIPANLSCLITMKELCPGLPDKNQIALAFSDDPCESFFNIHNFLVQNSDFYSAPSPTKIGKNTFIHPTTFIADSGVNVGDNCHIGPNVSILEGTVIENNVIIRAGTTIGSESNASYKGKDGITPIFSSGGVLIHNNVEIQSNCCISRAVLGGFTEIGESTKIDNLVHIGGGASIRKRCMIVALAVVGRDATLGNDVWIGPGSVVSDNISIGDRAYVTLGSVVTEDVLPNQRVTGNFAIEHEKFLNFLKKIR